MAEPGLSKDLQALAAELDALGQTENSPRTETCPFPEISDFKPVSTLGQGGMGTVYRAEQISLRRDVAVKVMNAKRRAKFAEEARTVASLHHPNIVQVFSAGRADDTLWFAMELVKGESADRHAFATVEEVVHLGIAVAEALAYAHRCGVLHRDINPSNIFIGSDGLVKLGDFGLACLANDAAAEKCGTRRYMAGELLAGEKATEKSDQFALGVTLGELLRRVIPDVAAQPADCRAIIDKAMAKSPDERYGSVEAMLADLRRFLAQEPVCANPPSAFRRFRLFAGRNPLAATAIAASAVFLAAFFTALSIAYVRTSRALEETHREAAQAA